MNNILFQCSLKILFSRQDKIYFSTDLLKTLISKKNKNRVFFNYLIHLIKLKNKKNKKNIDLLIYNRNYSVKNNDLRNKFLKIALKINLNIYVIGDHLNFKKIKNLGFITREKTNFLLKKTKFIINSGENPYNIFTIDAFNNHVDVIYEKIFFNKVNFFNNEKLNFLNFNNEKIINIFLNEKANSKIKASKLTINYNNHTNQYLKYFDIVKIYYSV